MQRPASTPVRSRRWLRMAPRPHQAGLCACGASHFAHFVSKGVHSGTGSRLGIPRLSLPNRSKINEIVSRRSAASLAPNVLSSTAEEKAMYTFATFEALQTGIPTTQLTLAAAPHSALAFVSLGIVILAAVGIGLF